VYIEKKSSPDNKSFTQKNRTTKIQKTIDLIKSNRKGKFLIYSEQNNTFSNLQLALLENNIDFVQMKGNVKMREKNLDLFKSGSIPVIFLNSNTDSAGINLTESTDIILYHHMPDFITNQIIGRANRIGRTIPLYVHHLNIQN
jgi:SNF2 family DNA or RNA helicase